MGIITRHFFTISNFIDIHIDLPSIVSLFGWMENSLKMVSFFHIFFYNVYRRQLAGAKTIVTTVTPFESPRRCTLW
jgi:hypothetical protein